VAFTLFFYFFFKSVVEFFSSADPRGTLKRGTPGSCHYLEFADSNSECTWLFFSIHRGLFQIGLPSRLGDRQANGHGGVKKIKQEFWDHPSKGKHRRKLIYNQVFKLADSESHRLLDLGALPCRALRLSMLRMIDNPTEPEWAHPRFWAPFIVVGEPVKN
jgi:hypothetical protein